ncbi:MAG: TonB family protein [Bacteroidales bacterium]|nr:TonB family protein [Bacteroidales bacterium]MBN2750512.1 TonB family protein [Bacteroidales bacterium]
MRKLILLITICLFFIKTNAQNDYQDLEYFKMGCKLVDSLKYNEAIYYFNKAIKANPDNTIYFYKRGNAYYLLKDFANAKEDFLQCLKTIPDEPVYLHLVGICNEKLGLIQEAINYYSKAIELNNSDADFYKSRATLFLKIDSLKLALNDYNYVLSFNPQDGNTYYNRGIVNFKLKEIESACSDWRNADLLNVKNASDYINKFCKKGDSPKQVLAKNDLVEMPKFNNESYKKLHNFIALQLRYPLNAAVNCLQGTVILKFMVKHNGDIGNIKVINPVEPELDEEAIRVIKLSNGLWHGGTVNGKPSDIELTFPITFQLKPDCSDGITHFINKGLKYFNESDFSNAITCFSEVIKRDPYNKEIINKRIQARKMIKDTLGAKEDMKLLDNSYFQSVLYSIVDNAQDTLLNVKIYYDSLWNICSQNNANYFRQTKWNKRTNFFEGEFKDYSINGSLICSGKYINKNKVGEFNYYYQNGNLLLKGYFTDNLPSNTWEFYFENSKISHKIEIEHNNINIEQVYDSLGNNMNLIGTFKSTLRIPNHKKRYNHLNVCYKNNKKNDKWTLFVDEELVLKETYKNGLFKSGEYYLESKKIKTQNSNIMSWILIPSNIIRTEQLVFDNEDNTEEYSFINK